MKKIAIMGGRVIDPSCGLDQVANIYIADGKIKAIIEQSKSDFDADVILNAAGLIVSPGLVDINANVANRLDNFPKCLTAATTLGITHFAANAFTPKHCLTPEEISYFTEMSHKGSYPKVSFIGPLTQMLKGQHLNELAILKEAGCIGFTTANQAIQSNLIKSRCYDYAAMLDAVLFVVPQDPNLNLKGGMHHGVQSIKLGLPGIPVLAETLALTAELLLVKNSNIKAHFCGVSAAESLAMLQSNVSKNISMDVAIHQLYLTEDDILLENGYCHVAPPFRSRYDRDSLRSAVKNGLISTIASDHIKLSKQAKEIPFQDSEPGIASWPLLLPLTLQLAVEENISLLNVLHKITTAPANILGIDAGHLNIDATANLMIFDPTETWQLSSEDLLRFGVNNPFSEWQFKGKVKHTLIDGKVVYSAINS